MMNGIWGISASHSPIDDMEKRLLLMPNLTIKRTSVQGMTNVVLSETRH